MLRSLDERWTDGERFYLALVDPLLKKTVYFKLNRPRVKVGFLPDCDWALPWGAMGINVIAESRKLDSEYAFNCCHLVENYCEQLCVPRIGQREREPFFLMVYDPLQGWRAECEGGHVCCVVHRRTMEVIPNHGRRSAEALADETLSSNIPRLEDGSTFAFMWPFESVAEKRAQFKLPAQRLWFVFIACQDGQLPSLSRFTPGPRNLLSLPIEVLARIGSYLEPEEYFLTLALIGRVFTSQKLKGQIPWTSIKLGASFDSLRAVEMVSIETLQRVECSGIWDPAGRGALYAKWKPVIQQESLTSLELEDPSLLHHIGVPPNLTELRLRMVTRQDDFWHTLETVQFPSSINRLVVTYDFEVSFKRREDAEGVEDSGHEISNDEHQLDPKWLFSAFPGLTDVHFHNVIFFEGRWEEVPAKSLNKITHLYVNPIMSDFPLGNMPNLKALHVSLREISRADMNYAEEQSFDELEYLVVETGCHKVRDFVEGIFSLLAPNLRFLQLTNFAASILCRDLKEIVKRLPCLEFLYIRKAAVSLLSIRAMMTALPALKDVEIMGGSRFLGEIVSLESFPKHPGDILRLTRFCGENRIAGTFNFVFSRATELERGNAFKFLHRNMGLTS